MPNPIGIISMFYARPFERAHLALFPKIKAQGLDFVELLVPEPGELDLAETRTALADAGLGVALAARVNLERDLTGSEPKARQAGIDYLKRCVDVAAALDATLVGGPLYGGPLVFAGQPPRPVPEDLRAAREAWAVEGLRAAAPHAEGAGVTLAVEPLNRFETDRVNLGAQALDLVKAVGSTAVGVMLDTFHMAMEEGDLARAILDCGPHLVHFQANENHRGFIGTGHLDWAAIARALVQAGYRGPITLEPFRRDDHRFGVPLAQWRAPARDEGPELVQSLAVLKRHLEAAR